MTARQCSHGHGRKKARAPFAAVLAAVMLAAMAGLAGCAAVSCPSGSTCIVTCAGSGCGAIHCGSAAVCNVDCKTSNACGVIA